MATKSKRAPKADDAGMNLARLIEQFGSEERCREYLDGLRWPEGRACIRCGATTGISYVQTREQYECESCGYHFSVTAGTALHDTHLPLWKWLMAAYLMCESKKGISANQLKRMIGVSYKTAWYLCHRIRHAMATLVEQPLTGTVEVDETYVGGKVRGRGRAYKRNKTIVVGAIQRGGAVRIRVEKRNDRTTLHNFIREKIADEAEAIHTDEWPPYKGCGDANTKHETVKHREEEWVRGDVHTQSIENVWSLFKRSIVGSYHHLSAKHLPAYVDEMEWRFNNRANNFLFRDTCLALLKSVSLPYAKLTAEQAA
ncbi:MAG TPA: IS1595 family transposase [Planctomycetota bacterium]|nr:IS1595 family transposase [Planctomycetota bacterium]